MPLVISRPRATNPDPILFAVGDRSAWINDAISI